MPFDWTQFVGNAGALFVAVLATTVVAIVAALFKQVTSHVISLDQIIAIVASVASCAAAVATYLTVREMKAGRVAAARGRLTTPGSDAEIKFLWRRTKNLAPSIDPQRIIIRNASAGVAHNIRGCWQCDFDLDGEDIGRINSWLHAQQHVSISTGIIEFYNGDNRTSYVVAAKEDFLYLGDLGPSQDVFCFIPQPVLGMVFLKWASLLARIAHGEHLGYNEVPLIKLTLTHDSPYERQLADELLVRFELAGHEIKLRSKKELAAALGGKWESFEITVAFETTTRSLYDIPKVVVSGGEV